MVKDQQDDENEADNGDVGEKFLYCHLIFDGEMVIEN